MIDESKLTPEWLAGFFDGEGCVCLRKHGLSWTLRVNITQANELLLTILAKKYNASYGPYRKTRKTKLGKESTCYEIGWYGKKLMPILVLLKDHVVVKKDQVELGLEFLSTNIGSGYRYNEEVNSRRESLRKHMRYLNHAGPYKPATETVGVSDSKERT